MRGEESGIMICTCFSPILRQFVQGSFKLPHVTKHNYLLNKYDANALFSDAVEGDLKLHVGTQFPELHLRKSMRRGLSPGVPIIVY